MSIKTALDQILPAITIFLMTIVGMDLTAADFRKVLKSPKAFFVGIVGQYLLPFLAIMVLTVLKPVPHVFAGMLLLATAPPGGISTYYSFLARANVALSVVLTTVSSILAAVTMPLFLLLLLSGTESFKMPLGTLFGQLLKLLVIPVLIGFFIRFRFPQFVSNYGNRLRQIGFVALGCLIAFIFYQTWDVFLASWLQIVGASVCFILVSMVLGYALGLLFRLDRKDCFTLFIEFGMKNIAITIVAALAIFKRTDFATFGAIYFLVEAGLILPCIHIYRRLE